MGDALLFEQRDHALGKGVLAGSIECCNVLVDDLQADARCWSALPDRRRDWRSSRFLATKSMIACALASARAISALRPPSDFAQIERIDIVLDAEHRRRVDRLALEDALDQLAALGHAEDLRQRPGRLVAFQPLDGARARG